MKNLLLFLFVLTVEIVFAGQIINRETRKPVEYVNIGIPGKNQGTVSDASGNYRFNPHQVDENDIVMISCIGYESREMTLKQFLNEEVIEIKEISYPLNEALVLPGVFVKKTLGVKTKSKSAQSGFSQNVLGNEMGIMMSVKKRARIHQVILNIAVNTYDTIFYRVNVYEVNRKNTFVNILKEPVYLTIPKNQVKNTIVFDVNRHNIVVSGKFLVTLEHVKDLGSGGLYFCSKPLTSTWFRKTSQGEWKSVPIGVSISVEASVEK